MEIKRTEIAASAVDYSNLFATKFGERVVCRHRPVLLEPPSVSTGGGAQAQQQLVLEPTGASGATVHIGSVNAVTRKAKIRTYECLQQVHRLRFADQSFPIEPLEYQLFFDDARDFLRALGMQVTIETQPPELGGRPARRSSAPPPGRRAGTSALWIWALLATAIALGLLAYVLR